MAQFSGKLNLESGAYINSKFSDSDNIHFIHKIFGSFNYRQKIGNSEISLGTKIRPQFFKNEFHSIKYKIDGSFTYNAGNILWRSNLSESIYNYNFTSFDYSFKSLAFVNQIEFNAADRLPINLFVGYSNHQINYENTINTDYIFFSASANKIINNYSFLGFGIYIQRFDTESKLNYNTYNLSSVGWKYGPQLKAQYIRNFLFDIEYKFLIYNTNNTVYPSYEHNINLLSGVILNEKLSVFLLAEFNFIRTSLKQGLGEHNPIYYTPTQNENEIYMKAAYKINKAFSMYTKIGYFRENIYLENYKLDGLNLLIGIEITN